MKKNLILSLATSAMIVGAGLISTAAMAEDVAGHPRINQVENRIDKQEDRFSAAEQSGKITSAQLARDDNRLNNQQNRLVDRTAENGGHITKAEQRHLNSSLNKNKTIKSRQVARNK